VVTISNGAATSSAIPSPCIRASGGAAGQDRHGHQGRGFRGAPVRGLHPPHLPVFHQPGQGLLAQGLRNSPGRPGQPRQGHRQPAEPGGGTKLTTVLAVPAFEPGLPRPHGHQKRPGQKDRPHGLQPAAGRRHHRPEPVEGDELIAARITDGTMNVFLGSAMGKSIRFHESDVRPPAGRPRGAGHAPLAEGTASWAWRCLSHGQTLLAATENGYGKRTSIDEYPSRSGAAKGSSPSRPASATAGGGHPAGGGRR
jgi:hypothetical protein